jgi:hypothetical protein
MHPWNMVVIGTDHINSVRHWQESGDTGWHEERVGDDGEVAGRQPKEYGTEGGCRKRRFGRQAPQYLARLPLGLW